MHSNELDSIPWFMVRSAAATSGSNSDERATGKRMSFDIS